MPLEHKLSKATNEDKQVNPIYVEEIKNGLHKLGGGIDVESVSYNKYTDGVFNCYYISDSKDKEYFLLQLECKLDVDLKDSKELAKVILQVCYYLKQFQKDGMQIPKVLVLGTKRNCLAAPAYLIYDRYVRTSAYPSEHNGKKISASTAPYHELYQPRLKAIENDVDLQSKIRISDVSEKYVIQDLCSDIIKIAKDLGLKEDVTVDNLARAYDFFEMKVIDSKQRDKLTSREIVGAFMQLMLKPENVTAEQTRNALGEITSTGAMMFNGKAIQVNDRAFNSFANVFAVKTYNLKDQKALTEVTDRLIEDTDRRRRGDFYTPTIWVDEAHKLMDKNLGDNWREEYMVWDCAWGTGNLTRDYEFSDLYCSTLIQEDLDTASRYNPLACKFQYDFLNDDVDEFEGIKGLMYEPLRGKVKESECGERLNFVDIKGLYEEYGVEDIDGKYSSLIERIKDTKLYREAYGLIDGLLGLNGKERKGLVFLINPPYKKSGAITSGESSGKIVLGKTNLSSIYKINASQLYSQFLYRIKVFKEFISKNINVCIFCPSTLYSVDEHRRVLKDMWCVGLNFMDGFIFNSKYFDGTGSEWAVAFSVFKNMWCKSTEMQYKFKLSILEVDGSKVVDIGNKIIYTIDKECQCTYWSKNGIQEAVKGDVPYLSNALGTEDRKVKYSKGGYIGIGGFWCHSNRVTDNNSRVSLWSTIPNQGSGNVVTNETFNRMISTFAARKLISGKYRTWLNDADQYMIPNTDCREYDVWSNDIIVYSIFNSASFQTSLRGVKCQGKEWDIYNEFFWLSRGEILRLADSVNNMVVYEDIMKHGKSERYVYNKLKQIRLSEDAKAVLDKGTEILEDTFKYREEFNKKHPEYQVNNWDIGWYQIKGIAKECSKDKLKEFDKLYKEFSDRLRPLVYELGFLYK